MKIIIKNTCQILCFTIIAAMLTSCGSKDAAVQTEVTAASTHDENENSVEVTQAQYESIGIKMGSPELKGLSALLKVNGYIDVPPQNLVSVTTQMGGIIKSTPLLQGSKVIKGQVIAVLQNQEYVQLQQDYLESRSQLELTDSEYKRQQNLAKENVNALKTVQQAKANYQIALTRENALRQRLQLININANSLTAGSIRSQINIYAPITGYVTKVNVNMGKFVNPNDVMFEIVNSANLHVELNVFEKDAARVKPGQRVRFTMTNNTVEQNAVVQLVGGEVNADKTITVHAIAKESTTFIPGTYLKAFIETGTAQVISLPLDAVVDFEGKKYIFLAKESSNDPSHQHSEKEAEAVAEKAGESHHFEMIFITVGINDGGFIEVILPKDVDYKDKVVIKGAYDLLSKLKNSEESGGH